MGKLGVLTFGEGDFDKRGFSVILQLGEEGKPATIQEIGSLPPNPELVEFYNQWKGTYCGFLGVNTRLEKPVAQTTNFSIREVKEKADDLKMNFNQWLKFQKFSHIREELIARLQETDELRLMIQTSNIDLRKLPWHLWDLLERYPKAEISVSPPKFKQVTLPKKPKNQVNILAVLGNDQRINLKEDRKILKAIPGANIKFLIQPNRQELNDQLWEQPWDILFFAGHSHTEGETGIIYINQTESLSINDLRYALKKAISKGLQLAIFNSCDGLGLAQDLMDLHLPQMIVMREPVPDKVAQEFLKYFLVSFSGGQSFYLAVKEAREKLQGWESQFPYASWLPIICQNPAETPINWQELVGITHQSSPQQVQTKSHLKETEQFINVGHPFDDRENFPFFQQGTIGQSRLMIKYCDITKLTVDVIVSSDDTNLCMGGGVSRAILKAGGEKVWEEARLKAPIPLGEIAITKAGDLKAQNIFHAAVLDKNRPNLTNITSIQETTRKCLQACDDLELHSIAFPALATGAAHLSPEEAAFAMLNEIEVHLKKSTSIALVIIALYAKPGLPSSILARFHNQVRKFMHKF